MKFIDSDHTKVHCMEISYLILSINQCHIQTTFGDNEFLSEIKSFLEIVIKVVNWFPNS